MVLFGGVPWSLGLSAGACLLDFFYFIFLQHTLQVPSPCLAFFFFSALLFLICSPQAPLSCYFKVGTSTFCVTITAGGYLTTTLRWQPNGE